jgi:hypothetical protein
LSPRDDQLDDYQIYRTVLVPAYVDEPSANSPSNLHLLTAASGPSRGGQRSTTTHFEDALQ